MKKLSALALLALALLFVGSCSNSARPPKEPVAVVTLVQTLRQASVALVDDDFPREVYCAGVWVSDDLILTANHCVSDAIPGDLYRFSDFSDVNLKTNSADSAHSAAFLRRDRGVDLALLRARDSHPHLYAQLRRSIADGERLVIVGHPSHMLYSWFYGDAVTERTMLTPHGSDTVLQVVAPVWFGNSGGGAFDGDGNLVGICSFLTYGIPMVGWFISPEHVAQFIDAPPAK